jgi:hypothetical protein
VSTLELEHRYFTSTRQRLPKKHVMTKHSGFLLLAAIGLCFQLTGSLPAQGVSAMKTLVTAPGAGKETAAGQDTQGFSPAFLTTSIRQLEDAMLWRDGIARVIKYNAPPGPWLDNYGARAAESLRQASAQATTASDTAALELLKNQFNNLQQWNNAVTAQQAINGAQTMNASALKDDPLFNRISECSRFLGTMLTSGVFADNPACH